MNNQDKIAIIVLNWNNFEDTERCIKSINSNYVHIYLSDNGSTDGSTELLERIVETRDDITFVKNGQNLGFSGGCNRAMIRAFNDRFDYFILLNNDCIVPNNDIFRSIIEEFKSVPTTGLIGGKILFWPDTSRIWSTGGHVSFWGAEKHIGHNEIDSNQYLTDYNRTFISGAFMCIKREVIEKIGFLPEEYFFGKEEWEYSKRVCDLGYKLKYDSDIVIFHEASSSHEWTDPFYVYNGTLSKIIYKKRNYSLGMFLVWFLFYVVYVKYFLLVRYSLNRSRYVKGIPPERIQWSMSKAIADSRSVNAVSSHHIADFKKEYANKFR